MYSQEQLETQLGQADKQRIYDFLFGDIPEDSIPEVLSLLETGTALDLISTITGLTNSDILETIAELLADIDAENNDY